MTSKCVYCHRARGKRSCPALGSLICAPCCGENRLVKIDCPADCPYLEAGTDYQRQRVGEFLRQDRRRVYREVFEVGGEKAAGLFNLIEVVCFSYFHSKPTGLDGEVIAALEFIRRLLSPLHFPAPVVPAFSQYLHKEFKAYLEKEKIDPGQAQDVVDLGLRYVKDFSGSGLRSNRFLTGLIGLLSADHPEVAAHLRSQSTDQPRIVLAGEQDMAAAALHSSPEGGRRILLPGESGHERRHAEEAEPSHRHRQGHGH